MRRTALGAVAVLLALAVAPPATSAQAPPQSGVRGTVLDTTCETACEPECPPPPSCRAAAAVPCPQPGGAGAAIVCPLFRAPEACTQAAAGCPPPPVELPEFPPYEGEAASVLVRRAGSAKVLGRVPVVGGHFTAHLAPGRYVLHAHVAEPCWTGNRQVVEIEADRWVPLVLRVGDGCAVHPAG